MCGSVCQSSHVVGTPRSTACTRSLGGPRSTGTTRSGPVITSWCHVWSRRGSPARKTATTRTDWRAGYLTSQSVLAYLAAATERVGLGTSALVVPLRNPIQLAKEVATIDVLSGGRVQLGVGAGYAEDEFDVMDIPFADRGRRLDEALRLLADGLDNRSGLVRRRLPLVPRAELPAPPGPAAASAASRRGRTVPRRIGGRPDSAMGGTPPPPLREALGADGVRRCTASSTRSGAPRPTCPFR